MKHRIQSGELKYRGPNFDMLLANIRLLVGRVLFMVEDYMDTKTFFNQ